MFLSREDHLLLHDACGKGFTSIVQSLCEMGADVRVRGSFKNTCLHLAAEQGHCDTVRTLVDACEADVNAENLLDKKPLHLAAYQGHEDVVSFLLQRGTSLSLLDFNDRPLYDLARHKRIWTLIVRNSLEMESVTSYKSELNGVGAELIGRDGLPTYRGYCLAAATSQTK